MTIDFKEEIKRTHDIVEFIGRYVRLKKAGQNYVGLCPFHEEKEPSFSVNYSKQIFHCFGCKKGGDIFTFYMEHEKIGFTTALKELAAQAGIQPKVCDKREEKRKSEQEEMYGALEQASYFFQNNFPGSPAEKYIQQRGINSETSDQFNLGYALPGWENLIEALSPKFDEKILEKAGLIIKREKKQGHYDRFRGRLMFPILERRGKVVGFAGRVLDNSLPKYINTPETELFHKGEILYGLNFALQHLGRGNNKLFVMEGYTDVIHSHQEELNTTVATLGTAFSDRHTEQITELEKRFEEENLETILCFDGDTAGKNAAARAVRTTLPCINILKVCTLPEGKDPDELLRDNQKQKLEKSLNSARDAFDFLVDYHSRGLNIEYPSGKIILLSKTPLREVMLNIPSNKQGIFINYLSKKLRLTPDEVREGIEINTRIANPLRRKDFNPQQAILREIIINPSPEIIGFITRMGINPEHFKGINQKIFQYLLEENGTNSYNGATQPLFEKPVKEKFLERLVEEGIRHKTAGEYIENLLYKLQKKPSQKRLELAIANLITTEFLITQRDFLNKGGSLEALIEIEQKAMEDLKR